jgi:hypothetical protein
MSNTWCPVDDSLLVPRASRVLATDGAQVVLGWVGGVAPRLSGAAFDDARCTTPSRQSQPQRIRRSMGTRMYLFNVILNYAWFLIVLLVFFQSSSHGGQPCSLFQAYAMSHKGKATSDVKYNPEDGSEAYSNPMAHARLSAYSAMARDVHGPEFDPATEDLDGEVVMRVGGGKHHGRYWLADGAIDSSSTPSLSQIRARSTSASPVIRPRQDTSQYRIQAL